MAGHDTCPTLTLTKCCLLERGIEVDGTTAIVPWGSNLDEIRQALRLLTGVDAPAPADVVSQSRTRA